MITVQTLDIAGTTFPWLLYIHPDNRFIDNRNTAEIETMLHDTTWEIKICLPGLFWQNDPLKRPYYFRIAREITDHNNHQTKSVWPDGYETPRHRLNLGIKTEIDFRSESESKGITASPLANFRLIRNIWANLFIPL